MSLDAIGTSTVALTAFVSELRSIAISTMQPAEATGILPTNFTATSSLTVSPLTTTLPSSDPNPLNQTPPTNSTSLLLYQLVPLTVILVCMLFLYISATAWKRCAAKRRPRQSRSRALDDSFIPPELREDQNVVEYLPPYVPKSPTVLEGPIVSQTRRTAALVEEEGAVVVVVVDTGGWDGDGGQGRVAPLDLLSVPAGHQQRHPISPPPPFSP